MRSLLALGGLAHVASGQSHGAPPASPLGDPSIGLSGQYIVLRDKFGFDTDQYMDFEIDAPKLYLDLARRDLQDAWLDFATGGEPRYRSLCLVNPDMLSDEDWSCRCKSMVSNFRDAVNKFNALFPPDGDRYKDDPFYDLAETITHQGYSFTGHYCDCLKATGASCGTERGQAYGWKNNVLNLMGEDGERHIFGDSRNPTWREYAQLSGPITNDYQQISSTTPFSPRWGDDADQNLQFWGTNHSDRPLEGFDGYENMGLLFRTQLKNFAGEGDKAWDKVMAYTDLGAKQYGNFNAEADFHNIRKIPRMMWRTMSDYPLIMPLAFFTTTIKCPEPVDSHCIDGKFPPLTAPAKDWYAMQYDGKRVLSQIFKNDDTSRAWLETKLGWPKAVIQLATSICLGGYHHLDYFSLDASITEEKAETLIDSNDINMDFVMRMGFIHDKLDSYIKLYRSGKEQPELLAKVNSLWSKFKGWIEKNFLLDLLKYKLDPYFPIGNASATRQLAPSLPVSNLPILEINTHGKSIPCLAGENGCDYMTPEQRSVNATLAVYQFNNKDPPVLYNISIRGHGESSRIWPKKTYGISFWNKWGNDTHDVSFLKTIGMVDNDEWVLKGFYIDMTLVRDHVAYNISRQMGMYAPRTYQSELYLITDNAERSDALHYKGVYLIAESISKGKQRINVPKNGGANKSPADIVPPGSGGYILAFDKFNEQADADVISPMLPKTNNRIMLKYPGKKGATDAQKDWIWQKLAEMELDMYDPDWLQTGQPGAWDSWVDVDSWANYFIHAELMKSVDGYRFSTYFYTEGNDPTTGVFKPFVFGPPWDYDFSSGNTGWVVDQTGQVKQTHSWEYMYALTIAVDSYGNVLSAPQLQHTPCAADWFKRMLDVPEFKNRVSQLYWQYRSTVLSDQNIQSLLADKKEEIKKPRNRNFATWDTLARVDFWPHFPYPIETTYDGKYQQMVDYFLGRLKWLDENIYGYIPHSALSLGSTCDSGEPIPDCLFNFQHLNTKYPKLTQFAKCNSNDFAGLLWVRGNWQSEAKMFLNKSHPYTDGSDCSVVEYLHWEASQGLGDYDCPVPGGPDGILPPYPNPSAPMKCPQAKCGADNPLMTDACLGTINYVLSVWKDEKLGKKYRDGGVDGTVCSVQKYLREKEGLMYCPEVRGELFPMFCVNNRCQKEDGTWSPTMGAAPTNPPTLETLPPTDPPTEPPTPPTPASPTVAPPPTKAPAVTICGQAKMSEAVCQAYKPNFTPKDPSTKCTTCDEAECCRPFRCAEDLVFLDDPSTPDDESAMAPDDACAVLRPGTQAAGNVPCVPGSTCDPDHCCFKTSCATDFPGTCPKDYKRKTESDDMIACSACDTNECCDFDEAAAQGTTEAPNTPTAAPVVESSSGAIVAVVIVILVVLLGGGAALFYMRQSKMKQKSSYINLQEGGAADYTPPAPI